jgi:putative transposase
MPHYRRNRVPGGTFFFTVNLLDRRSDLLVTRIDALRDSVRSGGETEEAEGATLFRPT